MNNHIYIHKTFIYVLLIHIFIYVLGFISLPDLTFKKKADLTIELSVMPASKGGEQNANAQEKISKKNLEKKQISKNSSEANSDQLIKESGKSQNNSVAGSSNSQTVDADYKASELNNPVPPYPALAVRMRLEGKVILLAEVLADGRAGRVSVETSSGHELLDSAALHTVKQWRFNPARRDGVITTQVVRIPITFNLKSR